MRKLLFAFSSLPSLSLPSLSLSGFLFGLLLSGRALPSPRIRLRHSFRAPFRPTARGHVAFILLLLLLSPACAKTSPEIWASMTSNASTYGFQPETFKVKPFLLSGLLKNIPGRGNDLIVYIEGDGFALTYDKKISLDPSPTMAQSYELAMLDPAPKVLYLARIGQYQPSQTGPLYQKYWAEARFANDAVEAANEAINQAKAQTNASHIQLIGFSGGGAISTLLAERRNDVTSLVTVAGLLDINWWVDTFDYKPLTDSLNPADRAATISTLPQIHINGKLDNIAPPEMAIQFEQKADFRNLRILTLANGHYSGWTKAWPQILHQYVLPLRIKTHNF